MIASVLQWNNSSFFNVSRMYMCIIVTWNFIRNICKSHFVATCASRWATTRAAIRSSWTACELPDTKYFRRFQSSYISYWRKCSLIWARSRGNWFHETSLRRMSSVRATVTRDCIKNRVESCRYYVIIEIQKYRLKTRMRIHPVYQEEINIILIF